VKSGKNAADIKLQALKLTQGDNELYIFKMTASSLWKIASINRRDSNKQTGYQRVLPHSRISAISKYIASGRAIPNAVIVALNKADFDAATNTLTIPAGTDVAWVIDGQHRLAGAHEAVENGLSDYEFPIVAFRDLPLERQVEQFVTINREAKGVPSSLVLDLLNIIPNKKPADVANERAADIAKELDRTEGSPFYQRIVIDRPQGRQVSLVNFVRKVSPLVQAEKGRLSALSLEEQKEIIENYFRGISETYRSEWTKSESIFFKTVGFGAMMNVFEHVLNTTLQTKGEFTVNAITEIFGLVEDFDFSQWSAHGSGTKAEAEAAKDFLIDFNRGIDRMLKQSGMPKIKLR